MTATDYAALAIAVVAMAADLRSARIPNGLLLAGVLLEDLLCLQSDMGAAALGAAVPLLSLFPLFCFRMIGAGDIKLFAVLGILYGPGRVALLICISMLYAAVFSLGILFAQQNLIERFQYFLSYLRRYLASGTRVPYREGFSPQSNLHLTVPIVMAVLTLGGII